MQQPRIDAVLTASAGRPTSQPLSANPRWRAIVRTRKFSRSSERASSGRSVTAVAPGLATHAEPRVDLEFFDEQTRSSRCQAPGLTRRVTRTALNASPRGVWAAMLRLDRSGSGPLSTSDEHDPCSKNPRGDGRRGADPGVEPLEVVDANDDGLGVADDRWCHWAESPDAASRSETSAPIVGSDATWRRRRSDGARAATVVGTQVHVACTCA
jgi:hypothetical protein